MRIAIDAHTVGTQLAGNVTYITNLIEGLAEIDSVNEYTLYVTLPKAIEMFEGRWPNFTVRQIFHKSRALRFLSFPQALRRDPADIFFVQFNASPLVPCKVVTSIHDLSYEHLPETFPIYSRHRMRLTHRRTARIAAHIVTCSEYSKQDIIETYRIDSERVSVVYGAASDIFRPVTDQEVLDRIRQKYDLPGDFILGVGSVQPRKNLVRLIEAYARLNARRDMPPLVLVGKLAWLYKDSVAAVNRFGVAEKVRYTGFVPDEDLPALYSAATCFVYPSFFEGFGLPPLEAMQCGTPVITGNLTSLPEVVGDAGLMVDPFSVDAIAGAVETMLDDSGLRADLGQRGIERAKIFSWTKTAQQTLDVFER